MKEAKEKKQREPTREYLLYLGFITGWALGIITVLLFGGV